MVLIKQRSSWSKNTREELKKTTEALAFLQAVDTKTPFFAHPCVHPTLVLGLPFCYPNYRKNRCMYLPPLFSLPKHPRQMGYSHQEKHKCDANVTPRHGIPLSHIRKIPEAHDMIGHHQMSHIGNGTRNQKVANHFCLCSCVKHSNANQREQAVDIGELESQDPRDRGQGGGYDMMELGRGESGRVEGGGDVAANPKWVKGQLVNEGEMGGRMESEEKRIQG